MNTLPPARLPRTLSALAVLASAPLAQGNVWTVDDNIENSPDFSNIGAAVLFASDGDLILVADGTYPSFTIDGESLTVVADLDADVLIREPSLAGGLPVATAVIVRNLAPDQAVTIQGLRIDPMPSNGSTAGALAILDNEGDVWIEDVEVHGNTVSLGAIIISADEALEIHDSASVAIALSSFHAPTSASLFGAPGGVPAARASNSNVAAFNSQFFGALTPGGANSLPPCNAPSLPASHGFSLQSGQLSATGCIFQGGPGGAGDLATGFFGGGAGGSGGDGLRLESASAELTTRGSLFLPGPAGAGGIDPNGQPCPDGTAGEGLVANGPVMELPGASFGFDVTTPLRAGEVGQITYIGSPGDQALIVLGFKQGIPLPLSSFGTLVIGPIARTFALGTVAPVGALVVPLAFTATGPGEFRNIFVQGMVLTIGANVVLGPPATLSILEAGF